MLCGYSNRCRGWLMLLRSRWVLAGVMVLGAVLLWRPSPQDDIHTEVQQRLLEAELGSARAVHFAGPSRALVPDEISTGALLTDLAASQPETRWRAAKQLAVRRDPRAVEAVIRAMHDPRGTLRVCVMASALGYLKDPRALSALTEAAFDPGNRDLRLCAMQSLGMIGDRRAVPTLIEAVSAGNTPVTAANALARIGDERAVTPIIQAAGDPQLCLWMVMALGELGSREALGYLSSLVNDPSGKVRQAATEAIWKIGLLSAADPVQALIEVLRDDSSETRRMWAAFRLGEFSTPAAIPGLIAALHDEVAEVQGRAAAALIRIGKPVLPAIKQLADHGRARASLYAVAILGYTGGEDEIIFLQSLAAAGGDDERGVIARRSAALIASFLHTRGDRSGFVEL